MHSLSTNRCTRFNLLILSCPSVCGNGPPKGDGNHSRCQDGGEKFFMKTDLSVWYPLEFDTATGDILPMRQLPNFTLDLTF